MRCCYSKYKGYSLIELLLAMALFVSLAGGLGYAIIRGVNAHAFEATYREATLQTRNVLDQMLQELRSAVIPTETGAMALNEVSIASAVWIPDPYGTTSDDADFKITKQNSNMVHRGLNRLVFTRKDPNSSDKYWFVEWFVSASNPNRIYRVPHSFTLNSVPYTYSDKKYYINDTSFLSNGRTGSGGSFGSNLVFTGTLKTADYIVAQLPGQYDRFSFAVEHDANTSVFGGTTIKPDKNGATYNTSLYKVKIKAVVHSRGDQTDSKTTEQIKNDKDPFNEEATAHKRVVVYNEQAYVGQ